MTSVNNSPDGFFSAPREDGLKLSGMFVLPGDTFRVRWQVKGWGWVVAKTTGDLVEKQTHLFFGETNLEFKLRLGQEHSGYKSVWKDLEEICCCREYKCKANYSESINRKHLFNTVRG
jgi:hypothetical protein